MEKLPNRLLSAVEVEMEGFSVDYITHEEMQA